jgi:hypothetical protein
MRASIETARAFIQAPNLIGTFDTQPTMIVNKNTKDNQYRSDFNLAPFSMTDGL